jgi:hypothetical protein
MPSSSAIFSASSLEDLQEKSFKGAFPNIVLFFLLYYPGYRLQN